MWVHGAPEIWCISFDAESLDRLHAAPRSRSYPGLPLGQLYRSDALDFSLAARHPEQVARAHTLGKRVFVWTVNEEADIRQMAALDVDGIISDRPSLLLTTL